MNKEIKNRLVEAKKYEMMALKALLPESAAGHVEVISNELKQIFTECIIEAMKSSACNDVQNGSEGGKTASNKVKKVSID